MNINAFLESININSIVSEQDVRTKIAIPIIQYLNYPVENRAEEFPIYGYEGRNRLNPKFADIMIFSDSEFSTHRGREDRDWVMNHALVAVELKKPTETISESKGQAQFYAMWSRSPYYICTNGRQIAIYKIENYYSDCELCNCEVLELGTHWLDLYEEISFDRLKINKAPQIIDKKLRYQEYCLSRIEAQDSKDWYWERSISNGKNEPEKEEYKPIYLVETESDILLLAQAGVGKTTCFKFLFEECVKKYLSGATTQIPIFLSAKFWKRNFDTIEEGIYKELTLFLPYFTEDLVKQECNKGIYRLFIDGLDECMNDKDLLIEEIRKLSKKGNLQIFLSCRSDRYYKEFENFIKYYLESLKEKEIISISTEVLGYNTSSMIFSLDKGLKKLIETPLYFYMWLKYCDSKKELPLPTDTVTLFSGFITYLLREYLAEKGNYSTDIIPMSTVKIILSKYAYLGFDNKNEVDLNFVIRDNSTYIKEVYSMLMQSGILYDVDGIVDFYQFTIKEYFCAVYVSHLSSSEIMSFLEIHNEDESYRDVIYLLMGLLQNEEEQDKVLDFLEIVNLPLYINCLKKRYNFSNKYSTSVTKESCEKFFKQVLNTFEVLVNTHFQNFKSTFYPWVETPNANKKEGDLEARIKGAIDLINLSVSFELLSSSKEDTNKVELSFSADKPIVSMMKDGREIIIPITSFTDNKFHYYFDISEMYSGIDCAREIAVKIIQNNIERILSSEILLLEEPSFMQLCYIEEALRIISPLNIRKDNELKTYDLSFNKQTINELGNIFTGIKNYSFNKRSNPQRIISFDLIWILLVLNKNTDINPKNVAFPEMDVFPEKSRGVWEYYSIDLVIKWLQVYYDEFQKSYRCFVEKLFPTLKNSMGMYQVGPFQYNLLVTKPNIEQSGFGTGGSMRIRWVPKSSIEECETKIELQEYEDETRTEENLFSYNENLEKNLKFFNRNCCGFFTESNTVLFSKFKAENSVRAGVYMQINEEIREILK